MATTVPFTLITPRAIAFDGEAELVIAVGTEGEVGILPQHAPYLTALRPGVLADAALAATEIDVATSRAELAQAQEEQRAAGGNLPAWRAAQAKIDFANAKLRVAGVGSAS